MSDQFTFVSVLLSIVIALALTHLLAGIAGLFRVRVTRLSLVYVGWVVVLLFSCVDYWFSIWGLRAAESWSLAYVGYLLMLATLLYVSCHLIMPDQRERASIDLAAFYETIRRKYLIAYFSYVALAMGVNITIDGFAMANVINAAMLVLIGCAWLWRDSRVQGVAVAGVLALFAYYAVTYIPSL
jgi:hypothetical protein